MKSVLELSIFFNVYCVTGITVIFQQNWDIFDLFNRCLACFWDDRGFFSYTTAGHINQLTLNNFQLSETARVIQVDFLSLGCPFCAKFDHPGCFSWTLLPALCPCHSKNKSLNSGTGTAMLHPFSFKACCFGFLPCQR